MRRKPVFTVKNPVIIDGIVYHSRNGKECKLSRIVKCEIRHGGTVFFETFNTLCFAEFDDLKTRTTFINACKSTGKLS